jgi:hypothetical protein
VTKGEAFCGIKGLEQEGGAVSIPLFRNGYVCCPPPLRSIPAAGGYSAIPLGGEMGREFMADK